MIEIELFQHEPSSEVHTINIWVNGDLTYSDKLCKSSELTQLRDSLHNELLWLDDYMRGNGFEHD